MPRIDVWRKFRAKFVSTTTETRFDPGADTVVAVLSLLALWGIYYYQSASESVEAMLLFLGLGNLVLTILFPLYYVCHRRSEPLSAVGITTHGWRRALLASTVGALALSPGLLFADEPLAVLVPHVIATGLMLWEPFFVHGWLQIRFERAFGVGPGVALTAMAFTLFHVGAAAPSGLLVLLVFGVVHAALFRAFGRNLLVLWPVLWAVGSARGTLDTVVFGWEEVTFYVGVCLVAGTAVYAVRDASGNRTGEPG
jgi:hypothetical protein